MDPGVVVPLLLALLLAGAVYLFVRRATRALQTTRQIARFQHDASQLGTRLDGVLGLLTERVDRLRRREIPAEELQPHVDSALQELGAGIEEARAIEAPPFLEESRRGLVEEIERAMRAAEMVLHACELMTGPQSRERGPEAQTAVKRGYLNLLHVREALAEHVANLAEARDPAARKWRTSRT